MMGLSFGKSGCVSGKRGAEYCHALQQSQREDFGLKTGGGFAKAAGQPRAVFVRSALDTAAAFRCFGAA
jgi:hypothetical protein